MRDIRRTFYWSMCNGHRYDEENQEFIDYSEILFGRYTPKKATNVLRKKYLDNTIQILNVEIAEKKYAISPENFMKYGYQKGE